VTRQRQTNLFLVGRDQDKCTLIAETFADDHPDVRLWRFRCIVDAGGALLRCRPSAIPDAVFLADALDDWTGMRLRECICARRELVAVPVFAFARPDGTQPQPIGTALHLLPEPDSAASAAACVRRVVREMTGAEIGDNVHLLHAPGGVGAAAVGAGLGRR
jgi:hypothetical protein